MPRYAVLLALLVQSTNTDAQTVLPAADRDTCASLMTRLAEDFIPASGAWTVTPMKLDMCSLRSIKLFAAAVADKCEARYLLDMCSLR